MRQFKTFIKMASFLAATLLLTSCAGRRTDFSLQPQDLPIHGIDISYYQENIDWQAVRAGGTSFAWIKATEGADHADRDFQKNWNAAAEAGVPRGAYHFYYFCRTAHEQLEWFKKNVPVDLNGLPPLLDMEWNGHSKTCRKRPSREHILHEMRVFLHGIEQHYRQRPVIYTTVDFHRDVLVGAFENSYPFWVRSVKGPPSLRYGDRKWTFWQYTAEGRVPGIRGNVDRNAFYGNAKDWQKFIEESNLDRR